MSRSFALRLELELGEVPITGHLTDAHGVCTPFAGWIQLVALIEQAGDPATTDDAARAAPTPKEAPLKRTTALLTGLIAGLATSAATAPAAPIATSAGLPTLTLAMNGKSIHVSGSMKAGAVIVVAKTSREEQSSPPLVKLARKVSFAQAFRQVAAHGGDTNYLDGHATITYNTANSAGTGRAQTVLTPGRWVALDSVNNNPATWPRASFTVSRSGHPASLPKPAATVKMIEFGFTGPSTWHEGELIRFQNAGFLAHMAVAAQAKDEQDAQTLSALLLAGQDNQAQKLATGFATFVGTASAGAVQQQRVTAAPGIYVLACFMDTQDHREHTRLGMERIIRIVP